MQSRLQTLLVVLMFSIGMAVLGLGSVVFLTIRDEVTARLRLEERGEVTGLKRDTMRLLKLHAELLPESRKRRQFYLLWALGMLLIGSACAVSALW